MARITDIQVGERRREDLGDIAGLAESLKKYGLLHPIIVDEDLALIAGQRRLEAAKLLGWTDIEVRYKTDLTAKEKREIELEENLRRKDLTSFEIAKEMVRKAKEIVQVISSKVDEKKQDPRGRLISSKSEEKDSRGRQGPRTDLGKGLPVSAPEPFAPATTGKNQLSQNLGEVQTRQESRDIAARAVGMNRETFRQAKAIFNSDEVKESAQGGILRYPPRTSSQRRGGPGGASLFLIRDGRRYRKVSSCRGGNVRRPPWPANSP